MLARSGILESYDWVIIIGYLESCCYNINVGGERHTHTRIKQPTTAHSQPTNQPTNLATNQPTNHQPADEASDSTRV